MKSLIIRRGLQHSMMKTHRGLSEQVNGSSMTLIILILVSGAIIYVSLKMFSRLAFILRVNVLMPSAIFLETSSYCILLPRKDNIDHQPPKSEKLTQIVFSLSSRLVPLKWTCFLTIQTKMTLQTISSRQYIELRSYLHYVSDVRNFILSRKGFEMWYTRSTWMGELLAS